MTLSRSPGDELEGSLVSDGARDLLFDGTGATLLRAFASDDAGRGALRSPTPPRVTGCERVATLSRSPGDGLEGSLVSDGARDLLFDGTGAILLMAFASGDAGVGRSAPLHPLGRRGARGL